MYLLHRREQLSAGYTHPMREADLSVYSPIGSEHFQDMFYECSLFGAGFTIIDKSSVQYSLCPFPIPKLAASPS